MSFTVVTIRYTELCGIFFENQLLSFPLSYVRLSPLFIYYAERKKKNERAQFHCCGNTTTGNRFVLVVVEVIMVQLYNYNCISRVAKVTRYEDLCTTTVSMKNLLLIFFY